MIYYTDFTDFDVSEKPYQETAGSGSGTRSAEDKNSPVEKGADEYFPDLRFSVGRKFKSIRGGNAFENCDG